MKRREFIVGAAGLVGTALPAVVRADSRPCPPPVMRAEYGTTVKEVCQEGTVPSWVPPPGEIAAVGLNNLDSQAPILGGARSNPKDIMQSWCGLVYAPTYGSYGSIVTYGGGHDNYPYNEVYRYDVASRLWSRISDPVYPVYKDSSGHRVDPEYGEYWADDTFTAVVAGQVSADHTYGHMVWLPQGSLGDDPFGYFYSPSVSSASGASGGRNWPHYMPLSAPVWKRGDARLSRGVLYGSAAFDSTRNRVVVFKSSNSGHYNTLGQFVDCSTQTVGTFPIGSPGSLAYYSTAGYDSAADLYMLAANIRNRHVSGRSVLELIDPATGAMKYAKVSGISIEGMDVGGWDWVQSWGAWVYYPGSGQVVYKLQRPSDPWNGTWVMSSQTMGGEAAFSKVSNPHYSRLRYVESVGCFLWASQTKNAIQAFNVLPP